MVVLSIVDDNRLYLNYWARGRQVVNRTLSECSSGIVASMCVESSIGGDVVFVGGCDRMDVNEGRPVLSAVGFDTGMREITSITLSDASMKNVFRLKRIQGISEDVVLCAGFFAISIVMYNRNTKRFQELKTLGGLHTGEIFDFIIHNNIIYSICSKDTYIHKY